MARKSESGIRDAVKLAADRIDALLSTRREIKRSKTFSVPDDSHRQLVITVCVLDSGQEVPTLDLRHFLAKHIPDHLFPDELVFVADLPEIQAGSGEVDVDRLRKLVSGEYARRAFAAINTWKYKRTHSRQPEAIVESFQSRLLMSQPLSFVTYWGAGRREHANNVDRNALIRLKELTDEAGIASGASVHLRLIFADVHASINQKPTDRVHKYFAEIQSVCRSHGFGWVYLSSIWKEAGMSLNGVIQQAQIVTLAQVVCALEIEGQIFDRMVHAANKHVEQLDPNEGLKRYLLACSSERDVVAKNYIGSVFLTYNDPSWSAVMPPLPTFPMYSYQKGAGEKPWFMGE